MKWAIHNTLKAWTLYGLNTREIQTIIKTMSINEIRLTQVCQEGEKTWHQLDEKNYSELFRFQQDEAEKFPILDTLVKEIGDTEYFVVRPQKTIHPRLHQRIDIEVVCQIFSTTRQFTTETIDLSEGGLHFKETVPDWVSGYFIVGVRDKNNVYQIMCSMVEDQKTRKRVQIVSEEQDPQYVAYKEWLLSLAPKV